MSEKQRDYMVDTTADPKLRAVFIKQRDALLKQVDAIEEYLGLPKTADLRQLVKKYEYYNRDHGIIDDK